MNRNIQIIISLVLFFSGAMVSTFGAARLSAWAECDDRYKAFIGDLDNEGELVNYYDSKGQHDYYLKHILTFHPSGRRYGGSNESALPIVGGAGVALLGIAALLDTLRQRKETSAS
jgi:hypothetical protein